MQPRCKYYHGQFKEEFEQLENEAREYFFALLPFERIFECDERIVNHQLGEKTNS